MSNNLIQNTIKKKQDNWKLLQSDSWRIEFYHNHMTTTHKPVNDTHRVNRTTLFHFFSHAYSLVLRKKTSHEVSFPMDVCSIPFNHSKMDFCKGRWRPFCPYLFVFSISLFFFMFRLKRFILRYFDAKNNK